MKKGFLIIVLVLIWGCSYKEYKWDDLFPIETEISFTSLVKDANKDFKIEVTADDTRFYNKSRFGEDGKYGSPTENLEIYIDKGNVYKQQVYFINPMIAGLKRTLKIKIKKKNNADEYIPLRKSYEVYYTSVPFDDTYKTKGAKFENIYEVFYYSYPSVIIKDHTNNSYIELKDTLRIHILHKNHFKKEYFQK